MNEVHSVIQTYRLLWRALNRRIFMLENFIMYRKGLVSNILAICSIELKPNTKQMLIHGTCVVLLLLFKMLLRAGLFCGRFGIA